MSAAISSLRILPAEIESATSSGSSSSASSGAAGDSGFLDVLHSAMDDMQHLQGQAEAKVGGVLAGNGSDVNSALIAVEKADRSCQLMMQVRNKIVSAYEEISRMQF